MAVEFLGIRNGIVRSKTYRYVTRLSSSITLIISLSVSTEYLDNHHSFVVRRTSKLPSCKVWTATKIGTSI